MKQQLLEQELRDLKAYIAKLEAAAMSRQISAVIDVMGDRPAALGVK